MRYPYAEPPPADDDRDDLDIHELRDRVCGYQNQIDHFNEVIRESRSVIAQIDAIIEHCKRMTR